MKVLFFSNLYPNSQEPTRAPFNKQKLAHLKKFCEIVVVAPIAWFPGKSLFVKQDIPFEEIIDGLKVYHPRVFYTPKILRSCYGIFYYLSVCAFIKNLSSKFNFDAIYSSWVYPDGFAAMKLSKEFKKPFICEALGSDINLHARSYLRRLLIARTLQAACKVVVASNDLKEKIVKLGVTPEKVLVIYIGVNHLLFQPMEKGSARKKLGLQDKEKIILFVGNLVKVKGIDLLLEAVKLLKFPDWKLYIVGKGELENSLRKTIKSSGLENKVTMVGACQHQDISSWMNAADLLCLPSLMEGLPNVILESFACGLPVVASRVGGIPEVINDENTGILIPPEDVQSLAKALENALAKNWDRDYIVKSVSGFFWENNACQLFEALKSCV